MNDSAHGQQGRTGLDHFETALLAELKIHVAQQPGHTGDGRPAGGTPRDRRAVVLVAGFLTVVLTLVAVATSVRPTPAYAVSPRNNGGIVVTVTRLEGADRLEEALGEHRVAADITYLAWGQQCAPGRYREVPTPGLTLTASAEEFTVEIPPGAVGPDDTFVLSAAVRPRENGAEYSVSFGITDDAEIAPCRIVDA